MNHAFASSKTNLTSEKLKRDLEEILNRRFDSLLEVRGDDFLEIFIVGAKKLEWSLLELRLYSSRKIEMRKGHEEICSWVQSVIQNELAKKYGGKCSDEGLTEKWVPQIRFNTFKEYFFYIHTYNLDKFKEKEDADLYLESANRCWEFASRIEPVLLGKKIIGK